MKTLAQAEPMGMALLARQERARFFTAARFGGLECLAASFYTHRYARHTHDSYVIGGIRGGCGLLTMRGGQHEAASGHLTLFNPQEVHDGVPSREGYSYCVTYPSITLLTTIAGEVSGRVVSGLPFFLEPVVHDPQGVALLTKAHHALEEGSDTLVAEELLMRAYGYCLTQHAHIVPAVLGREIRSVARVKELLARRYAEDLTLRELAAEAELSCYHLIRAFHHATGLTPHAYLVNQRIEAAKERLRRGDNLGAIAAATGFSDQAHLTRVFKARVGVTPGVYRAAVAL